VALAFAAESFYYTKLQHKKNPDEVDEKASKGSKASLAIDVFSLIFDIVTLVSGLRER
jgi:hypothetical protein